MAEAIVRIRGELSSEGFLVEVMEGESESRGWLEQLARTRQADAVVALLGSQAPDSVEVWVIDRVTDKSVVRRIPFEPQSDHVPKTIAIHTLELLRASFLEIALTSRPSEATSIPPVIARFADSGRQASRPSRFGVEVGGAAVVGFGNLGPAVLPLVRLNWALRPWLTGRAAVAGLGTRPSVQSDMGSADVAEEFALLGACYRFGLGWRLHPTVSVSAGILHTRVSGQASPPYRGRDAANWSFLVDASLGAVLPLADRFEISLAVHGQMAEPYPAIRFADSVVATSARPSILPSLTFGVWL
jgi:hypothetical protein